MGFREAEIAEGLELVEDLVRDAAVMPLALAPTMNRARSASMRSGDRLEPIARRSWSASEPSNPAQSIAICMSCSWKSGTPSVLPRDFSSSGCR